MSEKIFTDRSRVESFQRCNRLRYLEYHQDNIGLTSIKKPLPLAVGGSVHVGIAVLLREMIGDEIPKLAESWAKLEDAAVAAALADFSQYSSTLALDTTELASMQQPSQADLAAQLAGSVGMTPEEAGLGALADRVGRSQAEFDTYLAEEQTSLVEAIIRAYARRRLKPLLEQYEVLEVEREGQWLLSDWLLPLELAEQRSRITGNYSQAAELWFMSRPDALLLDRESRQLYILSLKTTGSWDVRKERDAQHDMQGLSEGIEVERRLAEWWRQYKENRDINQSVSKAMHDYLVSLSAPPRILGIRYEFMLKGERWCDKELTSRFSLECRSQRSHLIRAYLNPGMTSTDAQWNWSWEFLKPDGSGEESKLYYKNWHSAPVWEHMPIRDWISLLDASIMSVSGEDVTEGMAPRELGYQSPAQATGYTRVHPLDSVFLPPIVIYRNDDELRDWVDQVEAQETRVAESVMQVAMADDEGERRHLLNTKFPMTRRACEFPTCQFVKVCYGSEELRRNPLDSGLFKTRTPNHPQEGGMETYTKSSKL